MKKRIAALLLAGALALSMAGCGEKGRINPPAPTDLVEETPQVVEPVAPAEFTLPCYPNAGFHPITGENKTNLALSGLLYEGLFTLDQAFSPQNTLCQSYTIAEGGLSWSFYLRPGVTFSDGSTLTAGDVATALNTARTSALYAARLASITGVTAADGAVTVTLSMQNGLLPALLDIPIVKGSGARPLGTGPYALSGEGTDLTLRARADWWQSRTLPRQEIPLRTVTEADDLIHSFDTQDISMVYTDLTGTNALGFSGSFETVDYPTSVMLYMGMNTTKGVCRDEAVRRAIQFGVDRISVATALLSRHAQAAALPVSPSSGLYDKNLADTLEYAPQTLAQILTDAGWSLTDGVYQKGREKLALTLVISGDNTDRLAVANHVAANLTQAGVQVTVKRLAWEEYLAALEKGNFDLYFGEVRLTADFDPTSLLSAGGALNYGGYSDGQAAALLVAYRAASGEARITCAKALYEYLAEHPPFTVLCFKNWSVLTQWKLLSGATPTQQNIFYGFADWKIA